MTRYKPTFNKELIGLFSGDYCETQKMPWSVCRNNIGNKFVELMKTDTNITQVFCTQQSFHSVSSRVNPHIFLELYPLLLKHTGPDIVLQFAVNILYVLYRNYRLYDKLRNSLVHIVKKAVDAGANVNTQYFYTTPLTFIEDPELVWFLKSRGAKCFWDLHNRGDTFNSKIHAKVNARRQLCPNMHKNMHVKPGIVRKIPHVLHFTWLTSMDHPIDISRKNLIRLKETRRVFDGWRLILWINVLESLPSIGILRTLGFEIRNVWDYRYALSPYWDLISYQLDNALWGLVTLRAAVVTVFGGVYSDLDGVWSRSLTEETHKYDFWGVNAYVPAGTIISDNKFAASPWHPVLAATLDSAREELSIHARYAHNFKCRYNREGLTHILVQSVKTGFSRAANVNTTDVLYPEDCNALDPNRLEISYMAIMPPLRPVIIKDKCSYSKILNFDINSLLTECASFDICASEEMITGCDAGNSTGWLE